MVKGAICDLLFPEQAVVDNNKNKMTWCIPHVVLWALSLVSTADYNLLIKKALKMKDPNVKILVDKRAGNTVQNEWVVLIFSLTNHYLAAGWKGECAWCCGTKPTCLYWAHTPKTENQGVSCYSMICFISYPSQCQCQVCKEANTLPGNITINEQIRQLHERWECNMAMCSSEVCYDPSRRSTFQSELRSSQEVGSCNCTYVVHRFYSWLFSNNHQGQGTWIHHSQKPPNIAQFNPVSMHTVASKSPPKLVWIAWLRNVDHKHLLLTWFFPTTLESILILLLQLEELLVSSPPHHQTNPMNLLVWSLPMLVRDQRWISKPFVAFMLSQTL